MKAVLGSVVAVAAIAVLVSGTAAQQPAPAPAPAAAPAPATITTKIGYIDVQRVRHRVQDNGRKARAGGGSRWYFRCPGQVGPEGDRRS